MNILKMYLPGGLHNDLCLHASQYENWMSEDYAFHAHSSTPKPCNFTDTREPTLPENAWYSSIHHEPNVLYSYAMRCAIVKSTSRLGTSPARSYNTPEDSMQRVQSPNNPRPLSYISDDDHKGLRNGFNSADMFRRRHNASTCPDCKNPLDSRHPANGDLCLIMQLHTHAEFDQCPEYAPMLQQFMVVTRVLNENLVGTVNVTIGQF